MPAYVYENNSRRRIDENSSIDIILIMCDDSRLPGQGKVDPRRSPVGSTLAPHLISLARALVSGAPDRPPPNLIRGLWCEKEACCQTQTHALLKRREKSGKEGELLLLLLLLLVLDTHTHTHTLVYPHSSTFRPFILCELEVFLHTARRVPRRTFDQEEELFRRHITLVFSLPTTTTTTLAGRTCTCLGEYRKTRKDKVEQEGEDTTPPTPKVYGRNTTTTCLLSTSTPHRAP